MALRATEEEVLVLCSHLAYADGRIAGKSTWCSPFHSIGSFPFAGFLLTLFAFSRVGDGAVAALRGDGCRHRLSLRSGQEP